MALGPSCAIGVSQSKIYSWGKAWLPGGGDGQPENLQSVYLDRDGEIRTEPSKRRKKVNPLERVFVNSPTKVK